MSMPLALAAAVCMSAFTNHAGRVVYARPTAVANRSVVLTRADGVRVRLPLAVFPAAEQGRIRRAAGEEKGPAPSPRQASRAAFYRDLLHRNEALRRAGVTSDQSAEERRKRLEASLDKTD